MSILLVIAAALACVIYVIAWSGSVRLSMRPADPAPVSPGLFGAQGSALLLGGVISHFISLYAAITPGAEVRFGFAQALSATMCTGVALLWFEGLSVRVEALRIFALPLAALAALLPIGFVGSDFTGESARPLFLPHLLVGTLAYGVLMLAALHATLMTVAERALHGPSLPISPIARWVEQLPPLLALERILFRFIGIGFLLLTLTAISGVMFSEEVFGRPLRFDHKTLFTLISWLIFGALLVGRRLRGWRGRTALRLTLAGFLVLLLAYVGTRFVIEVILQRA